MEVSVYSGLIQLILVKITFWHSPADSLLDVRCWPQRWEWEIPLTCNWTLLYSLEWRTHEYRTRADCYGHLTVHLSSSSLLLFYALCWLGIAEKESLEVEYETIKGRWLTVRMLFDWPSFFSCALCGWWCTTTTMEHVRCLHWHVPRSESTESNTTSWCSRAPPWFSRGRTQQHCLPLNRIPINFIPSSNDAARYLPPFFHKMCNPCIPATSSPGPMERVGGSEQKE